SILESKKKVIVVRAARRTSKSFSSALKCYTVLYFCLLFGFDARCISAGPAADDTRHFWNYMTAFWAAAPLSDLFNVVRTYDNYLSHSQPKTLWEFSDGSYVRTGSCDDPRCKDIRGDGWDFANIDEFGLIPYQDASLEAAAYATKDISRIGLLWLVGTHDVTGMGEEFNRLFELGQSGHDNVESFTIRGDENPYTDKKDAETIKDIVTEAGFLREEMGEAVPAGGKLFPDFDIREHTQTIKFVPSLPTGGGTDFGFNKPYACLYQVWYDGDPTNPRNIHINVIWELSPKQYRIDRFSEAAYIGIETSTGSANLLEVMGTDPAGDNEKAALTHTDFAVFQKWFPMAVYTHNRELRAKANQVYLFKWLTGNKRIHISDQCPKLARFFAMASPDTNRVGAVVSAGWKKKKGIDDPGDGLAYGLINYAPIVELVISKRKATYLTPDQSVKLAAQMAGF
ncbi:MAG: hypothetical protein KAJ19_13090, partial [Gammaproteobacteria bacterium]|nr:hypothetical protein [Gammaproteobacteria bacterium]